MRDGVRTPMFSEPPVTDRDVLIRDEEDVYVTDPCEAARIDERHRLGLAALVFSDVSDGIVVTDEKARILDVNPAFCRITGYAREEVIGRNPRMMKSDRHDATFYGSMWQSLHGDGRWQGEVWDRRKTGEVYAKWLSISAVYDLQGKVTHYVGIFSDVTHTKRTEEQVERETHFDGLTGLPNRVLFRDRLRQGLREARHGDEMMAVLFLDIDDFRRINDGLGHRVGDELLDAVGGRIASLLRETDTVARLSEDEFAIVLSELDDATSAAIVARKIVEAFVAPFHLRQHDVSATVSVGVSLFPHDASDVESLLRDADTAMHHAKQAGRNTYRFYSTEMHACAAQHVSLEADLRGAIERKEFVIHYQPRVDVASGAVCAVEALIRWQHPRLGLVPPGRLVPIAEQTRLIVPIGEWVLREACRQGRAWIDEGLGELRVAVNLSAAQFDQQDLARTIGAILMETGLPPNLLEIELTESIAMRHPESTIETLLELRAMGVRSAIDDFGTGYSSLSYLKRFPIDALKIDRSFVRDLVVDPDDANIARAIIALAHNLRLRVVAEGVETRAQMQLLVEDGCDEIQGFLTGRPMRPDRIGLLVRDSQSLLPALVHRDLPASPRTELRSSRVQLKGTKAGYEAKPSTRGSIVADAKPRGNRGSNGDL